MDPRFQFLSDLMTQFFDERKAWVESDAKFVTETLEQAIDELVEGFGEGTIPGELRGIEQAISRELAPAWEAWKNEARATGDLRVLPGDNFWLAVLNLERAREKAQPRPPITVETIEQLTEQKVSDRQICIIYDWLDGRGQPELWRLAEERREPGKHTANWVPKAERRRQEQDVRQAQLRQQVAQRQARKVEQLTAPCKESIEELIGQGLSAEQIAEMRKCSLDEVYAAADQMGVERPPLRYSSPGVKRAPYDPEPNESAARIFEASAKNRRGQRQPAARKPRPAAPAGEPVAADEDVYDPEEALRPSYAPDLDDPEAEDSQGGDAPRAAAARATAESGESQTLEAEIIAYHQTGMDEHAIAQAVSSPGEKIGVRKVRAILKRFADDPAAFAQA